MVTKKGAIIGGGIIVLAFAAGLTYYLMIYSPRVGNNLDIQPAVLVVIPEGAYKPPERWNGEYVFSERYFSPNQVTISVGDAVEWVNKDVVAHTVTFHKVPVDGKSIDSGAIQPGARWKFVFQIPGEYEYHCTLHPWQAGKLVAK